MKIIRIIFLVLLLVVGVLMVTTIFNYPKKYDCYKTQCIKSTLDNFESCKDIGMENTGFLSSEHFYICDGNKVTKNCLEWGEVEVDLEPNIFDVFTYKCSRLTKSQDSEKESGE